MNDITDTELSTIEGGITEDGLNGFMCGLSLVTRELIGIIEYCFYRPMH